MEFTATNQEFEFPLFHDFDYESHEILNEICSIPRLSPPPLNIKKRAHRKKLKFNGLKKRSNAKRLPNYIQYFMLYIFSIVPNISKNDYMFVAILMNIIFKNDLSKFDYPKVIEHYKNIKNKITHYVRKNAKKNCEDLIKELFNYSVFYDKKYYLKCLKNFKHRNPNNKTVIPEITDNFYFSIVQRAIVSTKSITC